MKATLLLLGTAAVLAMIGTASAATQPVMSIKMSGNHGFAHMPVNRSLNVLYDQNDNSEGYGALSQNFESSFDAYDTQGADDFIIPAGQNWTIKEVDVTGAYNLDGNGPIDSENVIFYKDNNGKPGKVELSFTAVGAGNQVGDFVIALPGKGAKLKGGKKGRTYWVSVQVNANFNPNGTEWGWGTRLTANGNHAQWRNPGGGFGFGCTEWADEQTCLFGGPDYMFTLRGRSRDQ